MLNFTLNTILKFSILLLVARSICQRPSAHVLNGKQLKIIPMERPTATSSCGVMVKGIVAEKHTKDYISLFFEKGGKSVEDVFLDYPNSLAVVTYQNPNGKHCVFLYFLFDIDLVHHVLSPCYYYYY